MESPLKSVLDPSFRYVPSHSADVRKTFERVRRMRAGEIQGRIVIDFRN